jgi:glutamate formiminotransferase/formiminotetrahydrofolate cyclodeaminase
MSECVDLSHELANIIGRYFKIPVFCYAESALLPERKQLSFIRKGGYEGLRKKMKKRQWIPDYGPHLFSEKKGATVIGARDFLLAYNVNLDSKDVSIAKYIALKIRESGYSTPCGNDKLKFKGRLKHVKAIGWYIDEFERVQVSTNITNYRETGLHDVFEEVKSIANSLGVKVTGSELVGLVPKKAFIDSGIFYSKSREQHDTVSTNYYVQTAIKNLGLSDVVPFVAEERIIDDLIGIHLGYDVIVS